MAALRAHDAQVALGQLGHAGVAITLAEAGLGPAPAMAAVDRTEKLQAYRAADQRIDRHLEIAQAKGILNSRPVKACRQHADCTAANLYQWMPSDLIDRKSTRPNSSH